MSAKDISFSLPVLITKQNSSFVAYTPALDISTCGKTEWEAKKRFADLANIFLEELAEKGTMNEVLAELGWKKKESKAPYYCPALHSFAGFYHFE